MSKDRESSRPRMHPEMRPADSFRSEINLTQQTVNRLADSMGVETVRVTPPQEGFLISPLDDTTRDALNALLGPKFAAEGVRLQDRVMKVPINESREPMVSLPELFGREHLPIFFSQKPFHQACGAWAGKPRVFWVREQVAEQLQNMVRALNKEDLTLVIQDAFRPLGVQEGLFERRIRQLILPNHPDWSWDQILLEARSKTAINPRLSGHKGGAAVDAMVCTINGDVLDLGNVYPWGEAMVALDFPYLTFTQWSTRQIFSAVMKMAGLSPYPWEDWHASSGDNFAAVLSDKREQTIYGPIKGFDPKTGAVQPYAPEELNAPFFPESTLREFAKQT